MRNAVLGLKEATKPLKRYEKILIQFPWQQVLIMGSILSPSYEFPKKNPIGKFLENFFELHGNQINLIVSQRSKLQLANESSEMSVIYLISKLSHLF